MLLRISAILVLTFSVISNANGAVLSKVIKAKCFYNTDNGIPVVVIKSPTSTNERRIPYYDIEFRDKGNEDCLYVAEQWRVEKWDTYIQGQIIKSSYIVRPSEYAGAADNIMADAFSNVPFVGESAAIEAVLTAIASDLVKRRDKALSIIVGS